MTSSATLELQLVQGGIPTSVRVTRDESGELHLGSPESTSLVEQLLVYDLGDDVDACTSLAQELRAIGTGAASPRTRAWNLVRLAIGPAESGMQLQIEGAGQPMSVATRDLHDAVIRYRDFLVATAR